VPVQENAGPKNLLNEDFFVGLFEVGGISKSTATDVAGGRTAWSREPTSRRSATTAGGASWTTQAGAGGSLWAKTHRLRDYDAALKHTRIASKARSSQESKAVFLTTLSR